MTNFQAASLGFAIGIIVDTIIYFVKLYRMHKRHMKALETLGNVFRARLAEMVEQHDIEVKRYRALMMVVNIDPNVSGAATPKGLLQIIEENKPVYLSVKQTLEELLKRCDP